jgi:hypothetical protein
VGDLNPVDPPSGPNVGLSISRSDDLSRFGLTETHVRMALGEIARAVLVANGRLTYGGHLRPDGYTLFLVQEIERFGRRNRPFTAYIPFSEHRRMSVDQVTGRIREVSVLGSYVFLDPHGAPINPLVNRTSEAETVETDLERSSLTSARSVMASVVDGRVALGGQREGFRGRMPGVIEEAILAVQAETPLYIAGGYGGIAGDMAVALGIDSKNWLGLDVSKSPYLNELRSAVADCGWRPTTNGLTEEENQRLAITYRAGEIASLVMTGLNRITRSA